MNQLWPPLNFNSERDNVLGIAHLNAMFDESPANGAWINRESLSDVVER